MYRIAVPPDIALAPPDAVRAALRKQGIEVPQEPVSFVNYFLNVWGNDPRTVMGGITALKRWGVLIDKVLGLSGGGDTLVLEDQDFATLKPIVEQPKHAYPPLLGIYLEPFSAAVLEAKHSKE
jgi:hypothetical protein